MAYRQPLHGAHMTLLFGPVISSASFLANSKVYKCFLMDMLDHTLENSQDKDGDTSDLAETQDLVVAAQSLPLVEEDGSLGSGEDQAAVADLVQTQGLLDAGDEDVQYQFRSQEGTVTYRVVQVGGAGDATDSLSEIVTAGPGFSAAAGVQQAVLTNPINGQFYVIGSQEMLCAQSPRSLAPRASRPAIQIEKTRGGASPLQRDDRRRATHNEVERRRRDKINNWIIRLSKIIPECSSESAKAGQSKGGILAKACEYINELRAANQRLVESLKEKEATPVEMEVLRRENQELKRENSVLRAQLSQQGLLPASPELHVT